MSLKKINNPDLDFLNAANVVCTNCIKDMQKDISRCDACPVRKMVTDKTEKAREAGFALDEEYDLDCEPHQAVRKMYSFVVGYDWQAACCVDVIAKICVENGKPVAYAYISDNVRERNDDYIFLSESGIPSQLAENLVEEAKRLIVKCFKEKADEILHRGL